MLIWLPSMNGCQELSWKLKFLGAEAWAPRHGFRTTLKLRNLVPGRDLNPHFRCRKKDFKSLQ
jgi:hypothetical protein